MEQRIQSRRKQYPCSFRFGFSSPAAPKESPKDGINKYKYPPAQSFLSFLPSFYFFVFHPPRPSRVRWSPHVRHLSRSLQSFAVYNHRRRTAFVSFLHIFSTKLFVRKNTLSVHREDQTLIWIQMRPYCVFPSMIRYRDCF